MSRGLGDVYKRQRYAAEKIKPNVYLNSSYYERWLLALEILLIENNLVTKKEIIDRENQIKKDKKTSILQINL